MHYVPEIHGETYFLLVSSGSQECLKCSPPVAAQKAISVFGPLKSMRDLELYNTSTSKSKVVAFIYLSWIRRLIKRNPGTGTIFVVTFLRVSSGHE